MILLINQFDGTKDAVTETVSVYIDTDTLDFSVDGSSHTSYDSTDPVLVADTLRYWFCHGLDKINVYDQVTFPFASYTTEPNATECATSPGSCDLALSSVVAIKETQQGGNDGTVTAIATSSYPGIEYSLNNIDFQSSGVFNDLVPGPYTVYVKDSNGCTTSESFFIDSFDNPLVSEPSKEIFPGNVSRWLAAFNNITFKYQRKDFLITSIAEVSPVQIKVTLNSLLDEPTIEKAIAQGIFLSGTNYEFQDTPISHAEESGKSTFIFNQRYAGGGTGFINLFGIKQNYRVVTTLTSGSNPLYKDSIEATHSPNLKGVTKAELSTYLQSLLRAQNTFGYDVMNAKDVNFSASFTVKYQEVWEDGESTVYNLLYPYYVVYSAFQLQELYGGNMVEYVPFLSNGPAKFLQNFETPIKTLGLPYALNFLYSENIVGKQLYLETIAYDAGGNQIGAILDSILLHSDDGFVLANNEDRILIESLEGVPGEGIEILEYLGYNHLLISDSINPLAVTIKVRLYCLSGEVKNYVTEQKTIFIQSLCDQYVYLRWLNHLGGWDYFTFTAKPFTSLAVSNNTIVDRIVTDWENDETIADVISKTTLKKLDIGKQSLTQNEISGLEWLRTSIKVQMLSKLSPIKWQTVIVNPGTFELSQGNKGEIKLTLSLPEQNIQSQ